MTYQTEVEGTKKYKGNVVILLSGEYFSIRQPDSGLVVPVNNNGSIISLTINPTKVSLKKANQTISSYSFRINDKNLTISKLLKDNSKLLIDEEVRIFLGRTGVSMDFSEYFELPTVKITKMDHVDLSYNFSSRDTMDRMNTSIFDTSTTLQANIVIATTTFQLEDVSELPDVGFGFLDTEFISWTTRDTGLDQIGGITRGEFGSTPANHDFGTQFFLVNEIEENPIDILLQMMTSTGAATNGPYDVLTEGLGIDQTLIDVAEMESIRDTDFIGQEFNFKLFNIGNGLKFFENEILLGTNLRFIVNENQLISVTLLDQAEFDESSDNPINENTISKYPKWSVDVKEIVSRIEIQYDYDDSKRKYQQLKVFETALTDVDTVIVKKPLKLKFRGIRESLDGTAIVQEIGQRYLSRFETPTPEIQITTHIDKSLLNVGDKVLLTSSQIPNASGSLSFADSLEIISRAINHISGDVVFKLQYTSYAGIRGAYIAPCVSVVSVVDQSNFEIPAGRASDYAVGWKIRLWDKTVTTMIGLNIFEVGEFTGDGVRTITAIDTINDIITVNTPFTTTLDPLKHLIRFADYDNVVEDQKKFAFVGQISGGDFDDTSSPYKIGL